MKPQQMTYAVEQVLFEEQLRWYLVIQFDTSVPDKHVVYTWWEKPSNEQIESMVDFCFASITCYQIAANITGRLKVNKVFSTEQ